MKKQLILIEPRGFCFGVERALQLLDAELIKDNSPLYAFNQIVHNKTLVEHYKAKGVTFTQNITDIPQGARVVISAHGVSSEIKEELAKKGLIVIDATCPIVEKVHKFVKTFGEQGYYIIYIGDPKHDEAKGVIAQNPEIITVIQNEEDAKNVILKNERYAILSQTTLNYDEVEAIVKLLKDRYPTKELVDQSKVCKASTERQNAVKEYSPQCDLFLVIGSPNSSNAKKLVHIAKQHAKAAYLIENVGELQAEWLQGCNIVGLTSGASTPEELVQQVVGHLRSFVISTEA